MTAVRRGLGPGSGTDSHLPQLVVGEGTKKERLDKLNTKGTETQSLIIAVIKRGSIKN